MEMDSLWLGVTNADVLRSNGFGADFGVAGGGARVNEMSDFVFSTNPPFSGGDNSVGLLNPVSGDEKAEGGENTFGEWRNGSDPRLSCRFNSAGGVVSLLEGVVRELGLFMPQPPKIPLTRQLVLTLEIVATASESFNFSA